MHQRKFFLRLLVLFLFATAQNAYADGAEKAAVCGACHGADGNSLNPVWPSLAGQGVDYTVKQLKAFKSGKRQNGLMSPMAMSLSEEDMLDIALYYEKQPLIIKSVAADEIADAEKLYRGGDKARGIPACMSCHGPNGAGNPAAKYPAIRGQHAEYTADQLQQYANKSRTTDQQQMMRMVAKKLTEEEMRQLASYVSALR
jgi:cytochrome c553|tara:strand:+ start:243 stop:842 length:600 start_codon:yes stop_codon:yes gene_type:complete